MISTLSFCQIPTQEYVVPKSIPMHGHEAVFEEVTQLLDPRPHLRVVKDEVDQFLSGCKKRLEGSLAERLEQGHAIVQSNLGFAVLFDGR
jgi:hypothetical protein